MNTTSKWLAIVAVAFVSGSFLASPELRAFAANTVFSTDIVDGQVKTPDLAGGAVTAAKLGANAVNSAKIADGTVGAAEIATDAVGASELQGVTKLLYSQCSITSSASISAGSNVGMNCSITGASTGDKVIVSKNSGSGCFAVTFAGITSPGILSVEFRNACTLAATLGTANLSVVLYTT